MPTGSENGCGRLSVYKPITGCSSDAVIWYVSVMRPICANDSENSDFSIG
ncbi:major facilitator superfamily MFS_1 domain protein [Burkholderia pseudomallei MSHR684]|nr:major facilitator superfamily MFS_1 domain protein [Burkholderia pseudomallei MSHR684]